MGWEAEKEEIVQAARHLLSKGLVAATSGNVSMCLEDADGSKLLAITPTSMRYEEMKPEDVVVIDFEGDVVEGYANPSSESLIHIAVYKARPDIKCVIHTHSVYASVLAVCGVDLPPILDELVTYLGGVEVEQLGVLAGWSGPLQLVTSQAVFDCEGRTWTGRHVVPHRWVLESSTTEAGRSLEWFATVLGTDYNEIDIEGTPEPEESDHLGHDQAVAYLGPRIMNAKKLGVQQGGFMFPVPAGQMGISRRDLMRSALENLAFAIKGNALQLAEVSGIEPSMVCLGGGVTNIRAFAQLTADTLDTAIRVTDMKDPSPLGAAMCAATGVGVYGSLAEAAVEMKAPDRSIEPDKSNASLMEERFERWLSLYRGLEGLSGEL